MRPTEPKRFNRPVTVGEALGATDDGPLTLNTAEGATCPKCGLEPRLYGHTNPKGRDVLVYIPLDHKCRGRDGN